VLYTSNEYAEELRRRKEESEKKYFKTRRNELASLLEDQPIVSEICRATTSDFFVLVI
jgi:hypothetical protein